MSGGAGFLPSTVLTQHLFSFLKILNSDCIQVANSKYPSLVTSAALNKVSNFDRYWAWFLLGDGPFLIWEASKMWVDVCTKHVYIYIYIEIYIYKCVYVNIIIIYAYT